MHRKAPRGPSVTGAVAAIVLVVGCAVAPACGSGDSADPTGSTTSNLPPQTCIEILRSADSDVQDAALRGDQPSANAGASTTADVGVADDGSELRAVLKFGLGAIPAGATIDSAKLSLHAAATGETATVFVHRVDASWDEATVTYASLGDSFAPDHAALFANGGAGFADAISIDVAALVTDWASGAAPNHGVLLKYHLEQNASGTSTYATSEASIVTQRPTLAVCYTGGTDGPSCFDGIVNQGETGLDCGGPCAPCDPCAGITCQALDACHLVGTCDPATGLCSNDPVQDGVACDDGDGCTQADTCQAGVCVGASPVSCNAPDQCHVAGTCDPATGLCSIAPVDDGTACDDGDQCTLGDTCEVGVCQGSTAPETALSGGEVIPGPGDDDGSGLAKLTLDEAAGQVCWDIDWDAIEEPTAIAIHEGASGQSGPVTLALSASPQGCVTGVPPATIQAIRKDGTAFYLQLDNPSFAAGALRGQLDRLVVCTQLDQCHALGTCVPETGLCVDPPLVDGTVCNDGDECTTVDACTGGVCLGAEPVVCVALDQCHVPGTCDTKTGDCSMPLKAEGTVCDDGDLCTLTDQCVVGTCTGTNPIVCPLPDACHTAGLCDPSTGVCVSPAAVDGTACDDGNACTTNDSCVAGTCTGGAAPSCDDGNVCTDDACDPAIGCTSANNVDACDDGDACTQTDVCQAGMCVGGNPVGGVCDTGLLGACAAGTLVCANDVTTCVQDVMAGIETCNGLDDDCDGMVDEDTDPTDANTCAGAIVHAVAPGGFTDVFGTVDADGADYVIFDFGMSPAPGSYYHPKIDLINSGGGLYQLTVEASCGAGAQCASPVTTFEMLYPNDPNGCQATANCTDMVPKVSQWVVHITTLGGGPVCASYQVRASNI